MGSWNSNKVTVSKGYPVPFSAHKRGESKHELIVICGIYQMFKFRLVRAWEGETEGMGMNDL